MTARFIRLTEAASRFAGCSDRTLARMITDGRIPQPIRLSPRVIGWREETLELWLKSREKCASHK
ncbi:helix-turn-helix transcriptional regulator [Pseudomonas sp.]|uniref:helix-turn-helix transcriptional regulator n=1 Tax=Pseudomonas sp. TaxID=306 RepID=UPI003FD77AEE